MSQIHCPICSEKIQPSRILSGSAFCTCGHTFSLSHGTKRDIKASLPLVLFSIFIVGAVLHALNWDNHSLRIIPLKMKQLTGLASSAELMAIADICKSRNKPHCETQALEQSYAKDPKNAEALRRASQIYMKQKLYPAAVQALSVYYKAGGRDFSSRHDYAMALGEVGQFREAQKQFRYVLHHDKKSPQFQVARSYVDLLMKNREYKTAKIVIEDYRRASPQSALFLEKELKFIHQQLGVAKTSNQISYQKSIRRSQNSSPFDE